MSSISLHKLLRTVGYNQIDSPQPVLDLTNDSRQVKPGTIFIAIKGYEKDGHDYIIPAYKAGAIAIVAQKYTPNLTIPQIIVTNTRQFQARLAAEFFRHPSRELKLVGITGTNGKTSCTFMLEAIYKAAGYSTGLIGTLYNKIGEKILPTSNTSPDSILCQRLLRDMVNKGITHASMEVSSHAMVMNRVDYISFALGAITNFSADHLDLHKNITEYAQAKKSFFQMLPQNSWAIVNLDDPGCLDIAAYTPPPRLSYSLTDPTANVVMVSTSPTLKSNLITVRATLPDQNTKKLSFLFHPPGKHNLANVLLAITAALALGIETKAIEIGLESYRGIFRRLEVIYQDEYTVIDDAAHNPSNIDAVFKAVVQQKPQGISAVYAIRGNRGMKINAAIAQTLANWEKIVPLRPLIITNCKDTAGPQDRVLPDEEMIFRTTLANVEEVYFIPSLHQAVAAAIDKTKPGMTLLLMGAHPMDEVASIFAKQAGVSITTHPRPPPFGANPDP